MKTVWQKWKRSKGFRCRHTGTRSNSTILSTQAFKNSGIQAFKHSSIQAFKHSNIQTFQHSNIQTFKHSNIQTFKHSNIPTFQHSIIPTFQHSNIQALHHLIHSKSVTSRAFRPVRHREGSLRQMVEGSDFADYLLNEPKSP